MEKLLLFAFVSFVAISACQTQKSTDSRGIIVVNAPAAGEIRRVLVREGLEVDEGTPVVEIAVRSQGQVASPSPTEDPQARAGMNIRAAQAEVDTARSDVVRKEVEVQRLTPLVASGDAPQAQLDGARAEYEKAQRRLQQAQSKARTAQTGLTTARQEASATPTQTLSEQIVTAQASSAGTVTVISAKVGDRVTAGQPLATIRASGQ